MVTSVFIIIGKILLMFLLIGGMIMVLMSVSHLFHHDDLNTFDDDIKLRDDIEHSEDVVSDKSIFFNFLVKNEDKDNKKFKGRK